MLSKFAATVLLSIVVFIVVTLFVSLGVLGAESFWQVLAILLIGGPLAALFASWPIALGQALRVWPTSPSMSETSSKESQPSGWAKGSKSLATSGRRSRVWQPRSIS